MIELGSSLRDQGGLGYHSVIASMGRRLNVLRFSKYMFKFGLLFIGEFSSSHDTLVLNVWSEKV